jgi:hypothetical protein
MLLPPAARRSLDHSQRVGPGSGLHRRRRRKR